MNEGAPTTESLCAACGDADPKRVTVFRWMAQFRSIHESVVKGTSLGRPRNERTSGVT